MPKNKSPENKSRENFRQAIMSIIIGASVAFLTTLFEGLADFLRANSESIVAGMSSTAYYLAKMYRA
jgi:hypothetical protein